MDQGGEKLADLEVIYEVDTAGIGGHEQGVKERGYWCGQLLVFDPSAVTLLFILPTMPRCGTPSLSPFFRIGNRLRRGE